jgi:hypothetical protein
MPTQAPRTSRTLIVPLLLLALVEIVCFGVFSARLGFYHDDWTNLERLANAGGLWGGVKFYSHVTLERPLSMIEYPVLFALGGMHPLRYQLFYVFAEILEGWLLFILLDRLLLWRELALLASALVLIFPTHSVTHVWFSSAGMIITVDLVLISMIFHQRWIQSRRAMDLAAGQFFYLLGAFNYEIAVFLPFLLAGGLAGRSMSQGRRASDAALDFVKSFWFFGASLAVALLWERAIVSLVLKRNPRLAAFSPAHALKAYLAGLECVANRATDVCAKMMPVAWHGLGVCGVLAAAAFAAVWALLLARQASPEQGQARQALWTGLGAFAGAFIGGCAPFAASIDYLPMVYGVMSRTNGVISISGGLLWSVGLAALALRSRKTAAAALAAIVFCMTFGDWGYSVQWARSWRVQNEILARCAPRAAGLPNGAVVLLQGFPISLEPGGALVFGAHWDAGSALRLTTGRKDLSADVVPPATQYLEDKVALVFDAATTRPYSYHNLFLYDYEKDSLWRLDGANRRTLLAPAR